MTKLKQSLQPAPKDLQKDFSDLMDRIHIMGDGEKYGSFLWIQNTILNYMVNDRDKREMNETQIELLKKRTINNLHKN